MDYESGSPKNILLPWGKWGNGDAPSLPLLGHLLDTAATATALWDNWVSTPMKVLLSDATGKTPETLRTWFAYVGASHDVGKIDPVFQGQLKARESARFSGHLKEMEALGYPLPSREEETFIPERSSDEWRNTLRVLRHPYSRLGLRCGCWASWPLRSFNIEQYSQPGLHDMALWHAVERSTEEGS